ncbi:hypothetical protein DL96DRAFT_1621293 [Flagelloscypha sp. PMI_526]|nr:hypothetical protein DL96DRAFT_1621293 [Flagelloscypha sp. PMI_526]
MLSVSYDGIELPKTPSRNKQPYYSPALFQTPKNSGMLRVPGNALQVLDTPRATKSLGAADSLVAVLEDDGERTECRIECCFSVFHISLFYAGDELLLFSQLLTLSSFHHKTVMFVCYPFLSVHFPLPFLFRNYVLACLEASRVLSFRFSFVLSFVPYYVDFFRILIPTYDYNSMLF